MATTYALPGRVALITGAAQGIGFEAAKGLHERGCSVALLDIDLEAAQAAADSLGERALALGADVTDTEGMRAAVDEVVEHFGGLDIVVANAGVAPPSRPMSVVDPEAFERTLEINLFGVWRTVHPALDQVIARRGHIVVVASVYAFMNGLMNTPYAAAKAGVEQLGRALRAELAAHGASAGVAYFGFIDTKMVRDSFADPVAKRLEEIFPAFMLRRLSVDQAGRAIVAGVETRAPRIILPRWWRALSVLRGILNPMMDARFDRDPKLREVVLQGEGLGREERERQHA